MHFFACFIICRYAVPESPFSVPVKVGSQELNELISSLLSSNGTYKYNIIMAPSILNFSLSQGGGGEGALPYMSYKGMCRCERYGFQAV